MGDEFFIPHVPTKKKGKPHGRKKRKGEEEKGDKRKKKSLQN
jgi:hypothetical protein